MLTSACSNEDDIINNENTNKKGYELPVTVNVTRQDAAATRASFDGSKLNFGEGDKLFVKGNDYSEGGAGFFAGTLTWQSGGTFSGTILTENAYSGTIDALFTTRSTLATLIPANYGNYPYLSFTNKDTYSASINFDATKTFATSKATAVEQFSYEVGGYTSGTGFALHPANAILNFTITCLATNTGVDVALSDGVSFTISGSVTTDDLGTATFAIAVYGSTDLNEFSLTVGGTPIPLVSSSKELEAGKIYNINRSAFTMVADATSADKGNLICIDGHIHPPFGDSGCTKARVAKIVYVGSDNGEADPYNHGLALALDDAGTSCKWKKENTDAGHTKQTSSNFTEEGGLQYNATHNSSDYPAFHAAITYRMGYSPAAPTGCSAWFLASGYQWNKMADAVGGYDKLGLTENAYYWSSSEYGGGLAWSFHSHNGDLYVANKDYGYHVRACLAF